MCPANAAGADLGSPRKGTKRRDRGGEGVKKQKTPFKRLVKNNNTETVEKASTMQMQRILTQNDQLSKGQNLEER
jgi:hypothetical protein